MDKIFKIELLVLGFSYLAYLFCPISNQIGRYSFYPSGKSAYILDTTNADLYLLVDDRWAKINPRTGETGVVDIVPLPKKTNK